MKTSPLACALAVLGSLTCAGEASGPDPNAVAAVTIAPHGGRVDTGDSLTLSASVRNARGEPLSGRVIAWSSLDQATGYFNSPTFKELIPLRDKTVKVRLFHVEGLAK